jgi:Flp pilus assembly protein TadG
MKPEMTIDRRLRSERGITLVHVAVAIFVLTGFSAFVLDHGVLMLARGQAQNVADMAALAGAIGRAVDEPITGVAPPAGALVETIIQTTVDQHAIFGGVPGNTGRQWDMQKCPAGVTGIVHVEALCVRVDVFRDGTNASTTLPVYFAPLLGWTSQKIKATATAVAVPANGSRCLKPWLIPDRWFDKSVPPNSTFESPPDIYTEPVYGTPAAGTGYSVDYSGITLQAGDPLLPTHVGDLYEFVGASLSSITGCEIVRTIGQTADVQVATALTTTGVDALLAKGPVDVVIGLFSPVQFQGLDHNQTQFTLTIVNMMNVRITARIGSQIVGTVTGGLGDVIAGGLTPGGKASLIKKVQLVR